MVTSPFIICCKCDSEVFSDWNPNNIKIDCPIGSDCYVILGFYNNNTFKRSLFNDFTGHLTEASNLKRSKTNVWGRVISLPCNLQFRFLIEIFRKEEEKTKSCTAMYNYCLLDLRFFPFFECMRIVLTYNSSPISNRTLSTPPCDN